MYCIHCGKEIVANSKFCNFCGERVGIADDVIKNDEEELVNAELNNEQIEYEQLSQEKEDVVQDFKYHKTTNTYNTLSEVPTTASFYISMFFLLLTLAGVLLPWVKYESIFANCSVSYYEGISKSGDGGKCNNIDDEDITSDDIIEEIKESSKLKMISALTLAMFSFGLVLPGTIVTLNSRYVGGMTLLTFIFSLSSFILTYIICDKMNDDFGLLAKITPGFGAWFMLISSLLAVAFGYIDYALRNSIFVNSEVNN